MGVERHGRRFGGRGGVVAVLHAVLIGAQEDPAGLALNYLAEFLPGHRVDHQIVPNGEPLSDALKPQPWSLSRRNLAGGPDSACGRLGGPGIRIVRVRPSVRSLSASPP